MKITKEYLRAIIKEEINNMQPLDKIPEENQNIDVLRFDDGDRKSYNSIVSYVNGIINTNKRSPNENELDNFPDWKSASDDVKTAIKLKFKG